MVTVVIIGIRNKLSNSNSNSVIDSDNNMEPYYKSIEEAQIDSQDTIEDSKDAKIYVHITGAVEKEGLYKLDAESRLYDLIELCHGLKEDADINRINLAIKLKDQGRIYIPYINEEIKRENEFENINLENENQRVKLNSADQNELEHLPGIGSKRAHQIIELREKSRINSLDDLRVIPGFGDKLLNEIKDLVDFT